MKPLYLYCGRSGSGKTTIANILKYTNNFQQLESYTTRSPRYDGELGHHFVSNEEFDQLENIVAFTEYNSHRYAATQELVDDADIYIIDVPGVETLVKSYKSERKIVVLYFDTTVSTRIARMKQRMDSESAIIERLNVDEKYDWHDRLNSIAWKAKHEDGIDIDIRVIDANKDIDEVIKHVINVINTYTAEDKDNLTQEENQ